MSEKKLTDSEQYLWEYLQQNLSKIPNMSIVTLSQQANVSTATIVRTMQKKGYEGYTAFRHTIKNMSTLPSNGLDSANYAIQQIIQKNQQEVLFTLQNLNSTVLEDIIQNIKCAKRVIIFARGLSELIAQEMGLKFLLLNKYCEVYTDPNIIMTRSQKLNKEDIVIFISLQGETKELVTACQTCQSRAITTVTLTTNSNSPLAKLSDLTLTGHQSGKSLFPDYEIRSRLPLTVINRVLLDAYAIRVNK